jgi:hypothetical protein
MEGGGGKVRSKIVVWQCGDGRPLETEWRVLLNTSPNQNFEAQSFSFSSFPFSKIAADRSLCAATVSKNEELEGIGCAQNCSQRIPIQNISIPFFFAFPFLSPNIHSSVLLLLFNSAPIFCSIFPSSSWKIGDSRATMGNKKWTERRIRWMDGFHCCMGDRQSDKQKKGGLFNFIPWIWRRMDNGLLMVVKRRKTIMHGI